MRNVRHQCTRNCDRYSRYKHSKCRHERGSLNSGRGRQAIQDGALPVPSNDSRGNLNPDANVYAPRTGAGEVNLNVIEIVPVN